MQFTTSPEVAEEMDVDAQGWETTPELFGAIDLDELTATLGMDSIMGTPAFGVSSSSSGGSFYDGSSPAGSTQALRLSKAQEDVAINFILSSVTENLQSICKHFFTSVLLT